jgi:O-antigen/teichoic acid export membrane protein
MFFSCPSNLVEYIYLLKNKPAWILRYGILTFSSQILVVSLPAVFGYPMEYCVGGLVAISVARYIWLLVLLKKYALPKFSPLFIREHLHFGAPLIISALLGSSASYVDSMIVLNWFDPATFAIFRYGAKEFPLVLLLANAFATAMIPEFSDKTKLDQSLENLRRKSTNMMHFLFPATLVFLLLSEQIYPIVFNEEFVKSARIFNIYLMLISARLVFPHPIIIGQKKNRVILSASLAEFVTNVSLSLLFVRFWGIEGVAFATLVAYSLQKIIWVVYNKTKLGISPGRYINLKFLAFYTIIMVAIFCLIY